ncbi:MAG: TRAM domain-containing protein [Planctomycetota bacterium]
MLIWVFRALFTIVVIAVLFANLTTETIAGGPRVDFYIILWMLVASLFIDIGTPKKSLAALAGVFFGLLVGILISWALAKVFDGIIEIYKIPFRSPITVQAIKWILGVCICFLTISIIMRTKDDVRFVIPYVEFAKQTKGARPVIVDTSAIIDGRISDLFQNKVFDAPMVVPRFVLNELQLIADSADKLKRTKGRRGLDILNKMQTNPAIEVELDDTTFEELEAVKGVDQKIVLFTKRCNGRLATTDYNLSKVAQVRSVDVLNINDLANSLKAIALPGERLEIKIIKPGEESEQGIGYLPDGTMIVVEGARDKIGKEVLISVTSSLQTSAGKMIFGKFENYLKNNRRNTTS